MLAPLRPPLAGALAHPLTQHFQLPVSPLVAASAGAVLVLVIGLAWPKGRSDRPPPSTVPVASWAGSLSGPQVLTRALAVALLILSILAGRLGADDELDNLAPALVVGVAWPLLVLVSIAVGPVWRWADPWDGLARVSTRGGSDEAAGSVWPAAIVALAWVWYLSAYPDPLAPRSVGSILAVYSLVTVTGCLALGRERWLSTREPLGIALSWMSLLPRRRLTGWDPPAGAEALLGVLGGGVLFGAVRRSELWGGLNTADRPLMLATLGLLGSCALVAGLLAWFGRLSDRQGARFAMARGAVPAVAGIIVAVAMDRNRLTTSLQLVPGLLGDPFGRGWDLLGPAGAGLDPAPLGVTGLVLVQLAIVLAGHLAGAIVVARGAERGAREPAAIGLSILAYGSVIGLVSH